MKGHSLPYNRSTLQKSEPHKKETLIYKQSFLLNLAGSSQVSPKKANFPTQTRLWLREWNRPRRLHNDMGHLGFERVLDLVRRRFFWPKMQRDIHHFVTAVCTCHKDKPQTRPPTSCTAANPNRCSVSVVSVDFLHLERSRGGYEYILLIVDHFTRYAQTYPIRNKRFRRRSLKTLFPDLASQVDCIMTRVVNLGAGYSET